MVYDRRGRDEKFRGNKEVSKRRGEASNSKLFLWLEYYKISLKTRVRAL